MDCLLNPRVEQMARARPRARPKARNNPWISCSHGCILCPG